MEEASSKRSQCVLSQERAKGQCLADTLGPASCPTKATASARRRIETRAIWGSTFAPDRLVRKIRQQQEKKNVNTFSYVILPPI